MQTWKNLMLAGSLFLNASLVACSASESGQTNNAVVGSENTIVENKKTAERPVRVIVTLKNSSDLDSARTALLHAGAILADPIEGQPMIVVEALQSQLNTALENIDVKSIQNDSLSPSN